MKKKIFYYSLLVILTLLTSGCAEEVEPSVSWNNYSNLVKERLNLYIANKDCGGFQKEFDAAADNSDSQRRRTGEGNGDLMDYIIYHARSSGCAK